MNLNDISWVGGMDNLKEGWLASLAVSSRVTDDSKERQRDSVVSIGNWDYHPGPRQWLAIIADNYPPLARAPYPGEIKWTDTVLGENYEISYLTFNFNVNYSDLFPLTLVSGNNLLYTNFE